MHAGLWSEKISCKAAQDWTSTRKKQQIDWVVPECDGLHLSSGEENAEIEWNDKNMTGTVDYENSGFRRWCKKKILC